MRRGDVVPVGRNKLRVLWWSTLLAFLLLGTALWVMIRSDDVVSAAGAPFASVLSLHAEADARRASSVRLSDRSLIPPQGEDALHHLASSTYVPEVVTTEPHNISVAAAPLFHDPNMAPSVMQLPILNVPTIFRTAVVRERPRSLFMLWDGQATSGAAQPLQPLGGTNVTHVNLVLHQLSATSERVPQIVFSAEDYIAASGAEHSALPPPSELQQYDVGFVFDGERCSTNMWHGLVEVVVPVFGAKVLVALRDLGFDLGSTMAATEPARQLRAERLLPQLVDLVVERLKKYQKDASHVLLLRAPRKNIWGVQNLGCPILNQYPYGWGVDSVSGWILYSLFDPVTFSPHRWPVGRHPRKDSDVERVGDPLHTVFFSEVPSTNKKYEMRVYGRSRALAIRQSLFYGPSALCRWSRAAEMPPRSVPPFYLHVDPLCPWVYDVLKKYILSVAAVKEFPLSDAAFSANKSLKVGFVVRREYHNGRGIRNFEAVVAALREHVVVLGAGDGESSDEPPTYATLSVEVLSLEANVPFGEQLRVVNELDVVIGARGMGLTNAIFMKRYAGLLVLSGKEWNARLNIANDNYPWQPLHALRPWNPVVLSSCPVVFPTADFLKKAHAAAAAAPPSTSESWANQSTPQEISTYAKRCVSRSVNFCDMMCDVRKILRDVDKLVSMMRNAARRGDGNHPIDDYLHIADIW